MCYGKSVRNWHSRVEHILLSCNHGMPAALAQYEYKPVVLNLFAESSQIQIYGLSESHKQSATLNQKFFFECNLQDWPIRLSR